MKQRNFSSHPYTLGNVSIFQIVDNYQIEVDPKLIFEYYRNLFYQYVFLVHSFQIDSQVPV